jgi:chloramphenicol 3-O phosphotransferase
MPSAEPPARIVLLNGPGSVGKSTVARALQKIARAPLLHVSMDAFLDMLPDQFADHPETFRYRTAPIGRAQVTGIETGPTGAALRSAMRHAVAALAAAGLDLVVDDVWLEGDPPGYARLLAPFRVWRVGLTAPLEVLEAREAARGDRLPGLARDQADRVHRGVRYDMTLDTASLSPETAARRIAALAGL